MSQRHEMGDTKQPPQETWCPQRRISSQVSSGARKNVV